jgi:DnaJ-class molecular chaperone
MNLEEICNLLEIKPDITLEELKPLKKKLVLKYHPDKNIGVPGNNDTYLRIIKAFEDLKAYLEQKQMMSYDSIYWNPYNSVTGSNTTTTWTFYSST